MRCTHPFYAIDRGINPDTGKRVLKILPQRADFPLKEYQRFYGTDSIIPLPCGKCLSCRSNYTKDWSVRCMLEASLYDNNYFITFTYDDEHLPFASRKDFKQFLDRLDYYCPNCRFFACYEKGETTHRGHFHAILFNCDIPDIKFIGNRNGFAIYESDLIKGLWKCGLVDIQDVSLATCQYVAGYVMKKLRSHDKDEYIMMSTHPGIGAGYFDKHFEAIYDTDGVYIKGKKYSVPRYFDKLLEKLDADMFRSIKYTRIKDISFVRISELVDHKLLFDEELYKYEAGINELKLKNAIKLRSAV